MTPAVLEAARAHAQAAYPLESAGVVIEVDGAAEYRPCGCIVSARDHFEMDPLPAALAEDEGRLLGYLHSHPDAPITPSEADVVGCSQSTYPWWIIDPKSDAWTRMDPIGRQFEGRRFCFGVDDCWALLRDWYFVTHDWVLPDFVRADRFWERGETPHLDHMAEAGFVEIAKGDLKAGDALLFRVFGKTVNHCGVYLGAGMFLHHLRGRLSRAEALDGDWQERLTHVARHA